MAIEVYPYVRGMLDREPSKTGRMKTENPNTIHSGHFMISHVHDPGIDDGSDYDDTSGNCVGYDFVEATKETSDTYHFGPRSTQTLAIDASLTKLFQCLTLAYSGKISSPKWKAFRGMHLTIKDKVRLNNIIWREWFLQYMFQRKPAICQFATPLSDDIHTKPEAVVLEGKYWKRRLDTVTAEYKNWRKYFKERISKSPLDSQMQEVASIAELLERVKDSNVLPRPSQPSATDLLISNDLEDMDFTDTLLLSLKEPFQFPNPREFSQLGCADLIQPGLIQLQPNLDDFMDVDDIIMGSTRTSLTGLLSGSTGALYSTSQTHPGDHPQLGLDHQMVNVNEQLQYQEVLQTVDPSPINTSSLEYHLSHNFTNNSNSSSTSMEHSSLLDLVTAPFPQSQNYDLTGVTSSAAQVSSLTPKGQVNIVPMTTQTPPVQMASSPQQPQLIAPRTQTITQNVHSTVNKTHNQKVPQMIASKPASQLTRQSNIIGVTQLLQQDIPLKKDGFAVPMGKPVQTPRKQRTIAPAPPSPTNTSPSTSSTYLAQLLTKGTYPGAIIKVKKEQASPSNTMATGTTTYQPIRPAEPAHSPGKPSPGPASPASPINISPIHSPNPSVPVSLTKVSTSSFPTNVLFAAASKALGTTATGTTSDVICLSPKPSTNVFSVLSSNPATPPSPNLDLSPHPSMSPLSDSLSSLPSMMSPGKVDMEFGSEPDKVQYSEQRRVAHLSAEQKRRCNLKSGFDMLHTLIPALSANPKVSKAAMLQKTADYCKKLKSERTQMQKEADILRQEIESLNTAISVVQSKLPETGVPVTRQRVDKMKEMFESYVRTRTISNWKFWIFSIIISNLFDSYNNTVSTASIDELCRSVLSWLDQNCSLVSLRPTVLNALRHLSTTTSILTEPSRMREQATEAVTKGSITSLSQTRS